MPLTADRAKPAVPFGGIYRLIDFALSQCRQLRLSTNRRADAIQVAQPRPAHHQDVADVDDARWLCRAHPGAATHGQVLVPRQCRRDLPVAEHDQGREAGHCRRPRRRSRLSHGLLPDGRPAPPPARVSPSRRSASRSRSPTSSASSRSTPRTRSRSTAFREKPTDAIGLPDAPHEVLASMGNYVFDADVLVDAVTKDHDLEGSKHDMGGDIVPAFVSPGWRLRLRLQEQRGRRKPPIATAATGAMSGRWSPTTRRTWTSSACTRSSTSTTTTGRCSPAMARCRLPSSSTATTTASAKRSTRSSPPA
jgi:glucose-1-phosphate adenylyltransferase